MGRSPSHKDTQLGSGRSKPELRARGSWLVPAKLLSGATLLGSLERQTGPWAWQRASQPGLKSQLLCFQAVRPQASDLTSLGLHFLLDCNVGTVTAFLS